MTSPTPSLHHIPLLFRSPLPLSLTGRLPNPFRGRLVHFLIILWGGSHAILPVYMRNPNWKNKEIIILFLFYFFRFIEHSGGLWAERERFKSGWVLLWVHGSRRCQDTTNRVGVKMPAWTAKGLWVTMNALFLFRLIVKNINGCGESLMPTMSVLAKYAPVNIYSWPPQMWMRRLVWMLRYFALIKPKNTWETNETGTVKSTPCYTSSLFIYIYIYK